MGLSEQSAADSPGAGGLLLRNCNVISMHDDDAEEAQVAMGVHVLVQGKRISYVGHSPPPVSVSQVRTYFSPPRQCLGYTSLRFSITLFSELSVASRVHSCV